MAELPTVGQTFENSMNFPMQDHAREDMIDITEVNDRKRRINQTTLIDEFDEHGPSPDLRSNPKLFTISKP